MEPEFRFCTSADGTRLGYAIYGSGPPLLYANNMVASVDEMFTLPEARSFLDALAAWCTLVIFDERGAGASDREIDDLSPEAEATDIGAVADAAGLREFTLFAMVQTEPCVRYAIQHPERVQGLVIWFPLLGVGGERDREMARSFRDDWSYSRRLWAGLVYPNGPVSLQRAFNRSLKKTVSAEMAARRFEWPEVDFGALLPSVTAPTLVLQRETRTRQAAIQAAGLLPNSQLKFVPGDALTTYPGHEPIIEAIVEFMGLTKETEASADESSPSGTAIILFADIVESTSLTETMGDEAFREKARKLDQALRKIIREATGTPVEGKLLGDGVLAVFASAKNAIGAAMACGAEGSRKGLPLHLGIHAGDVIREEGNVFGGAVNIAARISGESEAGEVLVSDTVRGLARTSAGVSFEDRGERELKGVGEPVRVWAVRGEVASG